jgi:leucyl-tRNA synthetase
VRLLHQSIRKVAQDTSTLQFNTAIAQMMIYVTEIGRPDVFYDGLWRPFILLLAPYAPHLAEELWEKLGEKPSVAYQSFPAWDEELAREEVRTIVYQINGKTRAKEDLPADLPQAELQRRALANPRIQELLAGRKPLKVIAVPDKLVNIVIGA